MRLDSVAQKEVPGVDSTILADVRTSSRAGVLTDTERSRKTLRYRNPEVTAGSLFVAIGSGLAVVGLVDLAMLWYPMQLGSAGWEFAAVSRTFTNAPMTMVGLVLVAFGLIRRGTHPAMIRGAAVVFANACLCWVYATVAG